MNLILSKVTLIITTRCNLRCKLCCEYVPTSKPFPDMTIEEERRILEALCETVDHVETLHLSGGGEPFLHPQLAEMTEIAFEFSDKFNRFMLFTNSTIMPSEKLIDVLNKYGERITVQASRYGMNPKKEEAVIKQLEQTGTNLKIEKYYGESQSFGGWVNFGEWKAYGRTEGELKDIFRSCAVTRDMRGNWRTRDGKLHWCSRSQRGHELGLIPNFSSDYIDLLDTGISREDKRKQIRSIIETDYLGACDYCSGHQGTNDMSLRFQAAEQLK
jgi:hypothetical protein